MTLSISGRCDAPDRRKLVGLGCLLVRRPRSLCSQRLPNALRLAIWQRVTPYVWRPLDAQYKPFDNWQ